MRVLFISYDGMTDPLGQSQVIPYMQGLTKMGHRFSLISLEKERNYEKGKDYVQSLLKPYNIRWAPVMYTGKPPVLATMWDVYKMKLTARNLMPEEQFDMIHCRSLVPSLVGLMMRRRFGCKLLFDMRGFWADERKDGNLWNLRNPVFKIIYNFFKSREMEMLTKAGHIVSLTENAKRYLLTLNIKGKGESDITVIPCCADTNHFSQEAVSESQKERLRMEAGIAPDDFVLSYLGAIGTWYMLDEMLEFFKQLSAEIPHSRFLFITHEQPETILEKCITHEIDLARITIVKSDRQQVPAWLSLSQASIFFIKPSFSKKASSPTKQGEIMSMGIPLICNAEVGDTDTIVRESNSGFVIEKFDKEHFHQAVEYLKSLTERDHSHIHEEAFRYFSLEKGVEDFARVYKKVEET